MTYHGQKESAPVADGDSEAVGKQSTDLQMGRENTAIPCHVHRAMSSEIEQ